MSKVLCCYNACNLILTELRWICKKCGNECFTEQTGNNYGWLWKPDGKTHRIDDKLLLFGKRSED